MVHNVKLSPSSGICCGKLTDLGLRAMTIALPSECGCAIAIRLHRTIASGEARRFRLCVHCTVLFSAS